MPKKERRPPPPPSPPVWTTACPDWERRIVAGESLTPFPPLFPKEAESALDVFKELHVVDAAGAPTMGEVCRPWVLDFVGHIFGAYDSDAGRRLIVEFFQLISKKNGKSTIAAGIMLTALIRNWRESAEFLILAPTLEIANNAYKPARDMVKRNSLLGDLFQVQDHYRTITHLENGTTLKVVAADSETVGGKKATGVLVDELWMFGKKPNAEDMLREATGGLASRPEGFVIYLSTQSNNAPAGVFSQKLKYARGVRDGSIKDPQFLPVIYEFPEKMVEEKAYLEQDNFYVTNPNLGLSVDIPFLQREMRKAQEVGQESVLGFLAKHLNVEIGLALGAQRWSGADFWQVQATSPFNLKELLKVCEVVDVGIDGGGLDDLLALAVLGRHSVTRQWWLWTHAWAHVSVLERHKIEAARFLDFERDGDLTIVKRIGADTDEIADIVAECHASGKLDLIGVDLAGIGTIVEAIVKAGVPQDLIQGVPQGWKMNSAIKATERRLADGGILHGGQRMMAYAVGNARVEPRGNAVIITRQAAAAKIDPLLATLNAATLLQNNPAPPAPAHQLFFV